MKSNDLLGLAALVAIGYGMYKYTQKILEESPDSRISFDLFQNKSVTVDTLTAKQVADWIREDSQDKPADCILAFPTEATLKRFRISDCPAELDPKTNLLLFTVDKEYNICAVRLISFGEMTDGLRKLFGGEDYFVVKSIQKMEEDT